METYAFAQNFIGFAKEEYHKRLTDGCQVGIANVSNASMHFKYINVVNSCGAVVYAVDAEFDFCPTKK